MSIPILTAEQFENLSLSEKAEYVQRAASAGIQQKTMSETLGVSRKQIWRYQKLMSLPYEQRLKIFTGEQTLSSIESAASDSPLNQCPASPPEEFLIPAPEKEAVDEAPASEPAISQPPVIESAISETPASEATDGDAEDPDEDPDGEPKVPYLPSEFTVDSRPVPDSFEFDDLFQRYKKWIGWSGSVEIKEPYETKSRQVITVINDLHCPYQDNESIKRLIAETAEETDMLVIAGDFLDMFNWSKWSKATKTILPVDELRIAQSVLNILAENYSDIRIMYGNHDARLIRHLQSKGVDGEFLEALRWMTAQYGKRFSILHAMCHALPNVQLIESPQLNNAEFYFIYQVGDLIIGHPEMYSKIPNKAVGNFIHWLKSFAEPAGLVKAFRAAAMGHTHQAGKTWNDFGVVGFEMGCLEKYPDYVGDAKARTPRPWVQCYTKFVLEEGKVDINQSNIHVLR